MSGALVSMHALTVNISPTSSCHPSGPPRSPRYASASARFESLLQASLTDSVTPVMIKKIYIGVLLLLLSGNSKDYENARAQSKTSAEIKRSFVTRFPSLSPFTFYDVYFVNFLCVCILMYKYSEKVTLCHKSF